jgi:hypothetical protein
MIRMVQSWIVRAADGAADGNTAYEADLDAAPRWVLPALRDAQWMRLRDGAVEVRSGRRWAPPALRDGRWMRLRDGVVEVRSGRRWIRPRDVAVEVCSSRRWTTVPVGGVIWRTTRDGAETISTMPPATTATLAEALAVAAAETRLVAVAARDALRDLASTDVPVAYTTDLQRHAHRLHTVMREARHSGASSRAVDGVVTALLDMAEVLDDMPESIMDLHDMAYGCCEAAWLLLSVRDEVCA